MIKAAWQFKSEWNDTIYGCLLSSDSGKLVQHPDAWQTQCSTLWNMIIRERLSVLKNMV